MYRPKRGYKTGMIKLVRIVFMYRPKGRYDTGMFKRVRVGFVYRQMDDIRLVCSSLSVLFLCIGLRGDMTLVY